MADPLDDFIVAAAAALDLPLEPEWQGAIRANLEVTLKHANRWPNSRCRTRPSRRRSTRPEPCPTIFPGRRRPRSRKAVGTGQSQRARRGRRCARPHRERNPTLNAFTAVTADRARAKARAIDAAPDKSKLPLAGVPFAVKNLFDIEGWRRSPAPRSTARGRRRTRFPADRAAGGGRRGAGRRAQHGRIRLRLHRRERARRPLAQSARYRRA